SEKVSEVKAASARSNSTIPEASLKRDSTSKVVLTFSGIITLVVNDFTATASVGVIIAASIKARGRVNSLGKAKSRVAPIIITATSAKPTLSDRIFLTFFDKTLND